MNAFRFFVVFAFVIACGLAVQAAQPETEAQSAVSEGARQKRYPFGYPYGYSAYSAYHAPYAYHAPLYSSYSAYHYPSYYSRSYYGGYHSPYYY